MEDYRERIRNVAFFAVLTDDEVQVIAKIARINRYRKNHVILEEGEKRDTLFIILKGRAKVSLFDDTGKEYIIDVVEEGGFFGELSLFDELTGFVNIVTLEETQLLIIRRQDFVMLLRDSPEFALSIIRTLTMRLKAANEKLRGLAFLTVEERILQYLREVGEKRGLHVKDRIILERGPTQVEIASYCGCSRETVSRMIKTLIKKGRISVLKRQYTLRPEYGRG
jgi:CRP-like cAMP-binding protein